MLDEKWAIIIAVVRGRPHIRISWKAHKTEPVDPAWSIFISRRKTQNIPKQQNIFNGLTNVFVCFDA